MAGTTRPGRARRLWRGFLAGWRDAQKTYGRHHLKAAQFVDVPATPPDASDAYPIDFVDWWPATALAQRSAALAQVPSHRIQATAPRAMQRTAQLLWQCRRNETGTAGVFGAAFLWDARRGGVPQSWRGAPARIVDDLLLAILRCDDGPFVTHNLPEWHPASRQVLPISLFGGSLPSFSVPRHAHELAELAAVTAIVSQTLWSLVHVHDHPTEMRPARR